MKKIYIFGTGSTGRRVYKELNSKMEVLGFLDNDTSKWGEKVENVTIIGNGETVLGKEYDEIVVCSLPGMNTIKKQLLDVGIPYYKINCDYISTQVNARINFLQDYASMIGNVKDDILIAEGGVYQGDFAKEINKCFPNNTIYLFDTFEGFDERDVKKEHEEGFSIFDKNHLNIKGVEVVLEKMPYPDRVEIRKGYFPETAVGLDDGKFQFVNLDFDLYNPTLEGLRFFYSKLEDNGVILIHDYFNPGYTGIKQAVDDFEKESGIVLKRLPIGDHCSIAIFK